jgi:CRISPR-associated protein Cas2
MMVLVVERATPKIRGYLSSWCLQVSTGVYVANLPNTIRQKVWAQVQEWAPGDMAAVLVWSRSDTEQGLRFLQSGDPRRRLTEIEGLIVSAWLDSGDEIGSAAAAP